MRSSATHGLRSLLDWLGVRYIRKSIHGRVYRVPLRSTSLRRLLRLRDDAYEGEFYHTVLSLAMEGDTVFDVGAHLGEYTVGFSDVVGEQGRVVAFEANPITAAMLQEIVDVNNLQNVRLEASAVGSRVGCVSLSAQSHSPGQSLLHPSAGETCEVRMTTIDSFVRETGLHPDVIKMDVEGYELHVLEGARDTLRSVGPALCVEVHPARLEAAGMSPDAVGATLLEFGYRTSHRHDHDAIGLRPGAPYDVIFRKPAPHGGAST